MKRIIRTVALMLCIIMCFGILCSCEKANKFTKSVYSVYGAVKNQFDFDGAQFYCDSDLYSVDALMYQYGIEDEDTYATIENFALSVPGTNSAKTFLIITFKDGTEPEIIDSVEQTVKDVYIANLINTTAMYDMTQCEIAEKATFLKYDNALIVIAFDTNGNTEIIEAIEAVK